VPKSLLIILISKVLLERGKVSAETKKIVSSFGAIVEALAPESEFLGPATCLTRLHEGRYFEEEEWPAPLKQFCMSDLRTPLPEGELALGALGGCVWYLQRHKIDLQLITSKNFHTYQPASETSNEGPKMQLTGTMVCVEIFNIFRGTI
jgi:hypothetical protein